MRIRRRSVSPRVGGRSFASHALGLVGALALVLGPSAAALGAAGVWGSATPAGAAAPHVVTPHLMTPGPSSPKIVPHSAKPFLGEAPHLAAPAKTLTVNTTNDTDDANPGDGVCADTDGNCSLRAALEEANAEGAANPAMGTTEVDVPTGTYTLTLDSAVTSSYALVASDPAGLNVVGAGAGATVIQAMPSATDRVLDVSQDASAPADVAVTGVTIQNGFAGDAASSVSNQGGGILVDDSGDLLQLSGVAVNHNTSGQGGGIVAFGQLWAQNSSIDNNTANDQADHPEGGGLYCEVGCSLTNTTVDNNNATSTSDNEVDGGGLFVDGALIMDGGSVSGNTATTNDETAYGGGLYVEYATELDGTTIDNNTVSASVPDEDDAYGGAIYTTGGLDTMKNTTVSGNSAHGYFVSGGGLSIYEGDPVLTDSTVTNNTATGGGGAAYGGGISTYYYGAATISDSTISGNTATDSDEAIGGGILAYASGGLTVSGSTIDNNTVTGAPSEDYGGGIYGAESSGVSVTGTTLAGNTATDNGVGGGAYDDSDSSTWTNDLIMGNSTTGVNGSGGGLFLGGPGDIEATTVAGNSAMFGGGVYNSDPLVVRSSTISGNTSNLGGGLYVDNTLEAENTTIADNSTTGASDQGGGIYQDGSLSLRFTTLNGNTSDDGRAIYEGTSDGGAIASSIIQAGCDVEASETQIVSGGFNVLGDSTCVQPVSSDKAGVSNFMLSALGNYGGPAQTMVPFPGSPAIGAGGKNCPPTDQRGVPRPQGVACDAGAVETGQAYWQVASDGGIFSFGGARFFGSMGGRPLNKPVVGNGRRRPTATATGRWRRTAASSASARAPILRVAGAGSTSTAPIVGMAATPDGKGYWLVASDGGIFCFGDAMFFGSMGGDHLNKPVVGHGAANPTGGGYWQVASDGGIFTYGPGAGFLGSAGSSSTSTSRWSRWPPRPTATATGSWPPTGGSSPTGGRRFFGTIGGSHLNKPMVGMAGPPERTEDTGPSPRTAASSTSATPLPRLDGGSRARASRSWAMAAAELRPPRICRRHRCPPVWRADSEPIMAAVRLEPPSCRRQSRSVPQRHQRV